MGPWMRGRKLLEAELTITMKIKVFNLDENIPKKKRIWIFVGTR